VSDGRFTAVRRKLFIAGGVIACLVLAGALTWPHVSDASPFKPWVVAAVKQATGRDLVIDGPARFALLPTPRIVADDVRFANAEGTKDAQMLDVKSVSIGPAWMALLTGRVEIGELTLVQPTVVLERDANGTSNWDFASAPTATGATGNGAGLRVGRLTIRDGKVSYLDPKQGVAVTAENIDMTGSVGSPNGPFSLRGSATVNGTGLEIDAGVGALETSGNGTQASHKVAASLRTNTGSLDFDGKTSALAPGAHIVGHLSVATGSLPDFLISLVRATGQETPPAQSGLAGRFTFDGGIDLSADKIAVNDFRMALDGDKGTGSISLTLAPTLVLVGKISLPKLDIDKWLAPPARPVAAATPPPVAAATPPPVAAAVPAPAAKTPAPVPAPPPTVLSALLPPEVRTALPASATIDVTLEVAEATYNNAAVKNASIAVDMLNGVLTIPTLTATLPGDMVLQAHATSTGDAAHPLLAGDFSFTGPRLRETLDWLQIDVDSVPTGKLNQFALRGKLAANGPNLQLTDGTFQLDDLKGTASASMTVSMQTAAISNMVFQAGLDTFDFDAYRPASADAAAPAGPVVPTASAPPSAAAPPLPASLNVGLKAKVGKLIYRQQTLNGVDADLALTGNTLKLNDVKAANLLGAKVALHGSVTDLTNVPRFDLVASITTEAADTLLPLIGAAGRFKGKIGAMTASGGIAGTASALSLKDFNAALLGASVTASGTITLAPAVQFNFPQFGLQVHDASQLILAATGSAATGGPVTINGALNGSPANVVFKGSIQARGTAMDGSIGATLGGRPNFTIDLRVPGTLDFDEWIGGVTSAAVAPAPVPGAPAPPQASGGGAASTPIDPAALRGFDATVKLATSVLTLAPLRVTYGDLSATIKNGVLTVNQLTGQFYGGAVDFSGTVDATGPTLALDFKGSVRGIYLGALLRSTATTNRFGSSLTVSLNGEVLATDIAIKGAGRSSDEIRNSLSGSASIGGYIYAAVDKGMVSLGVIGASLTGMDTAALVLRQFVNRKNTLSGRVDIAANQVRTETLTVQGQDMTAHVASTTSVLAGTTDTTIAFVTPDNMSSLFTTVKGPLSAPAMNDNSVRAVPWQGFSKPPSAN
jgi:AsmA family/AsmA-like C-terminal region